MTHIQTPLGFFSTRPYAAVNRLGYGAMRLTGNGMCGLQAVFPHQRWPTIALAE
jgi:hypothetical protein